MQEKIIVTGGGTGGHVFPALAIAEELRSRGYQIAYVGSKHGLENKLVPPRGFPLYTVDSGKVKNQSVLRILKSLWQLLGGIVWAFRFLKREKPAAVLGVGGYVSVPVGLAAFLSRIPLYIQEQNVSVGIANRALGKLAKRVFLGFEDAKSYFPARTCVTTGNPVRPEFQQSRFKTYKPTSPDCVLIFGGSQGARAINDVVIEMLPDWATVYPNLTIIHQTGEQDSDRVKAAYDKHFGGRGEVVPFISDMAGAYDRAALVVARSGALTVSELIQVGRPSLLVPLPRKGQNDQTANANFLQTHQVALTVEQGDGFSRRFRETFTLLWRPEKLSEMASHFSALRGGNALVTIGDLVERDLKERGK
jgi:UDP-N-acetylglucosamine--N-acetylmuramyl-(pentapeptide) pyrophosphoryl-undecaprenol N-acetylglucosamine transferase